jgi:hypothetical protein
MSPDSKLVQRFKKSRPGTHVPLLAKETVLGPAGLRERGDRRGPREMKLAHYVPVGKFPRGRYRSE